MKEIKQKVISYLNMGLNPTVIGFQDDGLYYLFDNLLQGKQVSNSYDPTFTFIHVSLSYLEEVNTQTIEDSINQGLERDQYKGDTIFETLDNEVEVVCVLDDIAFIDNPAHAIKVTDNMVRKYRGSLHFIYIIENPFLINKLTQELSPSSNIFDGLIFQEINKAWDKEILENRFKDQFKKKLSKEKVEEISKKTNNHFGLFKRLYKDEVLKLDTTDRYINLLINDLSNIELNTFKKIANGYELNAEEERIKKAYEYVNFIKNNKIAVPMFETLVKKSIVKEKIDVDEESKLIGLDLNVFNTIEQEILRYLLATKEIVPKDKIADIVWGDDSASKYSEWALDQRISRLRRKIIDNGFNIDVQTVYGKGYKIVKI